MRLLVTSGIVSPAPRNQRQSNMRAQLRGHTCERAAGHRGGDGRDARFMPANTGIDDAGARGFHGLGLGDDIVPDVATFDQVQHRQSVNQDEVRPTDFTHATDDLQVWQRWRMR